MKKFIVSLLLLATVRTLAQSHQHDTIAFDPFHLSEVVVIDASVPDEAMTAPKSVDHRLELKLKQLKGVSLISRGSFAQEVIYRGQGDARLQVKLNGMRIYSACTDKMDPSTSYVVANNLQAAEMQSGCATSCGNSGLAGSLNLEMKQADFNPGNRFRWGYDQQFHSNTGGLASAINLQSHHKKFAWRVNGSWQQHGNYQAGGGQEVAHSQNQKHNWAINSAYRLSEREMLQLDLIYDLAHQVGFPALPMDVGTARAVIAGATYHHAGGVGAFQRFSLKLYHNDIYHEMDDSQREQVSMPMDMPGWSQTSGATFNFFDWQAGGHNLDLALEYFTNYRKAEMTMYPEGEPVMHMLSWPAVRLHGLGVGMTDHWHWGKSHISTTFRMDYEASGLVDELGERQWQGMGYPAESGRHILLPQLKTSLSHPLGDRSRLELGLGYGQRAPSTSELYGFYLFNSQDGYDYLGKPDLLPESLLNAEGSYHLSAKRWQFSSTIFLQQYFQYIFGLNTPYDAMTPGARGVRGYENIPSARFVGLELSGKYRLNEQLQFQSGLDYLRGVRPGQDLPMVPPLRSSLLASWCPADWELSLQGQYACAQTHYNMEYGDRFTPSYALLDASVAYKISLQQAELSLAMAVNNLFDHHYRDHLNWGGIPAMGRNIVFSLQLSGRPTQVKAAKP